MPSIANDNHSPNAPYAARTSSDGEELIARARFHWVQWLGLGVALFALGWLILPLYWLGPAAIRMASTELDITNRRLILKTGWLTKRTSEAPLESIESIHLHQGLIGQVFGLGRLTVHGAGGGSIATPVIADVLDFRRAIESALEQASKRLHVA